MALAGIEIRNFRSIGDEPVVIYPMEKCNILIGKNNVGKSNVIRAFTWITDYARGNNRNNRPHGIDRYNQSQDNVFSYRLTFRLDVEHQIVQATQIQEFQFEFTEKQDINGLHLVDSTFAHIDSLRQLRAVLKIINASIRGDLVQTQKWFETNLEIFYHFRGYIPEIEFIPQFRQIQEGDIYSFNGADLIRELEKYQHPPIGQEHLLDKFNKIQNLVQSLLHLPQATIDIPQGGKQIAITNNNLRLPLEAYGTGVHELIILATAILSIDNPNTLCCIEEPEIHLHPSLQREFIQFVTEQTDIRYLISTHSPTLINVQATMPPSTQHKVQVFHLMLDEGATVGGPVMEDDHALFALNDLGVRASDILQSNCVIWVEGPSDRIYLNRWLELLAPHFIEGLHFSIMFYGGRLLSHLGVSRSSEDKVPLELIDLLKINQHAVVIIDSDRDVKGKRINATKNRIRKECDETESLCWITEGREIENYLPEDVVSKVFTEKSGKEIEFRQDNYQKFEDRLDKTLKRAKVNAVEYAKHKVEYSRLIVENFEKHHIDGDLKKHLETLIEKITLWNQ